MPPDIATLQLQLSQLEGENDEIRQERDQFRADLSKFRKAYANLEGHVQCLEVEINDLRRNRARTEASRAASKATSKSTAPLVAGDADILEVSGRGSIEREASFSARLRDKAISVDPEPLTFSSPSRHSSPRISLDQEDPSLTSSRSPSSGRGNKRRIEAPGSRHSKRQKGTRHELEPTAIQGVQDVADEDALCLFDEKLEKYIRSCIRVTISPALVPNPFSWEVVQEIYSADKTKNILLTTPEHPPQHPTKSTFTVFTRTTLEPPQWQYMGEYRTRFVGHLSAPEFKGQAQATRDVWTHIFKKNAKPSNHTDTDPERATGLTEESLIKALERGTERINLFLMSCASYDRRFVEDLVALSTRFMQKSAYVT